MTAAAISPRQLSLEAILAPARRNTWLIGLTGFLVFLLILTKLIQPTYSAYAVQGLGSSMAPLALAAVAQAFAVLGGGIDLSIGSMMALTSVAAATAMTGQSEQAAIPIVIGVLILGLILGAVNGALIVATRVPDIVVTLGTSFVWAGCALLVRAAPGGSSAQWLMSLGTGSFLNPWIPLPTVVMIVIVALVWIPFRSSRSGLSLYAIGSNRLAAFRSGVSVGRTKILSYIFTGFFSALAGLALTSTTGVGTPVPGPYTLESVAAVVLGGVSLAGGRGGVAGPIVAVVVLQLIATDMTFLNIDTNLALVAQGVILVGILMFGSLIQLRRARA